MYALYDPIAGGIQVVKIDPSLNRIKERLNMFKNTPNGENLKLYKLEEVK